MQTLNSLISVDQEHEFDSINLEQTVNYYETIIDQGDEDNYNYWHLGLAYLLQQREVDAQATWFIPFAEAAELETVGLTNELSGVLDRVASQKFAADECDDVWLICQHLRAIDSAHVNNLLRSILLELRLGRFTPELLTEWQAVDIVSASATISGIIDVEIKDKDQKLVAQLIGSLLFFPSESTVDFIKQCLLKFSTYQVYSIEVICRVALVLEHRLGPNSFLTEILEICRELQPENTTVLQVLCQLNCNLREHKKANDISLVLYNLCDRLQDRIIANHTIIKTLLSSGNWKDAKQILSRHLLLLETFTKEKINPLELMIIPRIMVCTTFLPCSADQPDYYRSIQNQIAQIYLECNQPQLVISQVEPATLPKQTGVIRIGYLGSTLRSHSVGWLSRWLWQYHDREKFQIFTYGVNQNPDDQFYQDWFRDRSDVAYCCGSNANEIAAQIRADEVDILIDLDSLTLDITCEVLAAKPAPIQVSWLGWDATGLSTVDYFIADRYVLPDHAQDYYQEQIWRLPHTYLAVDGFEVGVPTISRKDLDIPNDAVVYWSGQSGYKRHPDTVRAQLRIIKSVPNSYFLIKGDTDPTIIQEFFGAIAAEEGVDFDRLRFLGSVADEYTHRANLAIADIVLDTFPYNGATTTLETLWMGIPMVTQVGQQFAARNSYTFMLNAGIEEGIAWNQQEYIDWGIKLGLDRELRWQIKGKLHAARATAPVWNARQFTLDLEQAYREMWAKYQAEHQHDDVIDLHPNN
jgi:predicted O-linked N-acetylglucosamine transferase (SPINDLY family)